MKFDTSELAAHTSIFEVAEIIKDAEYLFGQMDTDANLKDITYRTDGNQYPELIDAPNFPGKKSILLTSDARYDKLKSLYQLSHEIVHLVSCPLKECVTVLEEGCAVYFAFRRLEILCDRTRNKLYDDYLKRSLCELENSPNYYKAYNKVKSLFEYDLFFIKTIRTDNELVKISDIDQRYLIGNFEQDIFEIFKY